MLIKLLEKITKKLESKNLQYMLSESMILNAYSILKLYIGVKN
jgi:hypothetical protein